ncbi:UvrD-helicase domain-containing protein [Carboxydochorda subterranea]|uniref:UvrD-helicase domain-containing protein n=1 Tax=Carboxydichorda subterranea TaxID=3109565 RepID=A0ABZ1BTV3_9FIRM|nr:UvrD-helicase domain-containing protein [Limnochorda sp. L945t]WRP16204.1 UvrD-helicase domain-containing protein [Limnochorda sp. L945t]
MGTTGQPYLHGLFQRKLLFARSAKYQIRGIRPEDMPGLIERIGQLLYDPVPDGRSKVKLEEIEHVYRVRAGDLRILYAFDSRTVQVLAIESRDKAYRGLEDLKRVVRELRVERCSARTEAVGAGAVEGVGTEEGAAAPAKGGGVRPAFDWEAWAEQLARQVAEDRETGGRRTKAPSAPLPRRIDAKWLADLGVPAEHHPKLIACRTEDELLEADVPPDLLAVVIDNLYINLPKAIEDPLYEVQQVSDLLRYREGELLDFLLHLDEEQRKLADWRVAGPSLIRGGPGTGKSTVALYRVKELVDRWSPDSTGPRGKPRILFTTYTNSLIRSSRQLLEQLLGPQAECVDVDTADRVAMRILAASGERPTVVELADARTAVREAIASVPQFADRSLGLARLRPDYWLEEFEWVIDGRALSSVEEYLAVDRAGREVALRPEQRRAVWALYEAFLRRLRERSPEAVTWGQVRRRALELVKGGQYAFRYDAVVVDEAQDLTPVALSLLSELSQDPSGLYLTADINQSLYARGVSWHQVSARLRLRGRSVVLRRNYRLAQSIAQAASAFLRAAWGADDGGGAGAGTPMVGGPLSPSGRRALADAEALVRECVHDGPPPVLMGYRTEAEQYDRAVSYIRRACQCSKRKLLKLGKRESPS